MSLPLSCQRQWALPHRVLQRQCRLLPLQLRCAVPEQPQPAGRALNTGHAFRQLDVGDVQGVADFQLDHIHFDVLGQVFGQTGHFQLVHVLDQVTAVLLDALGLLFVHEVQGHVDVNFHIGLNPLKVSVHDEGLGGVTLQVLDNRLLLVLANIQGNDVGEERLIFRGMENVVMGNGQGHRVLATTIKYGRNLIVQTTQAAARTFALVRSNFTVQFKIAGRHNCLLHVNSDSLRPACPRVKKRQ